MGDLPFLEHRVPIVDEGGRPTPQFMRWFQENVGELVTALRKARDAEQAAQEVGEEVVDLQTFLASLTLSDLNDIDLSAIGDDKALVYEEASQLWKPKTIVSGGGGGGGGGGDGLPLVPYPDGLAPNVASAVFGIPALAVIGAFAHSSEPVSALYIPCVGMLANTKAIPVIYGGVDPLAALPNPNGQPLLATGPAVALPSNTVVRIPFSAPFTPTKERWYWVGVSLYDATGSVTFGINVATRRQWWQAGTFNPAPANLSAAMSAGVGNNTGWWVA